MGWRDQWRGAVVFACVSGSISAARGQVAASPLVPDRSVEAVVLSGADFPQWSGGAEITFRRPQVLGGESPIGQAMPYALQPSDCRSEATENDPSTDHSCAQRPDLALYGNEARPGTAIARLLGYRWDAGANAFVEIPFQVDERFTRYLSNNRSGFAFYSGVDEHTTYVFDKENFRFQENGHPGEVGYDKPWDPRCDSRPRSDGIEAEADPMTGLDDNDEIVFMAKDAGAQAPVGAALPPGILEAAEVVVTDPLDPSSLRYVYVMRAAEGGPTAAFDAANGYLRYQRDSDADMFVFSESSYEDYGAAPKGPYCDPETHAIVMNGSTPDIRQRRPKDTAWVSTDRYKFRYEGRWLMTELRVSPGDRGLALGDYGPDLIDRWKARAFQQDPSSSTPCCGYEEEDTNWGGSSILLGERVGPVRAIRETWGADSGTNVIRRETFYRTSVNYASYLRVHPIPPLDGIYTQWDYNAGRMTKYYNPMRPDGVVLDGKNDEVFGNLDDPCNPHYDTAYGPIVRQIPEACSEYHQSVDVFDPTFSMVNATLQWEQVSGMWGTLVTRWLINKVTPGGAVQGLLSVPYYRDDSCFDDGTGTSPGPRVRLRSSSEIRFVADGSEGQQSGAPRRCWTPADLAMNGYPDEKENVPNPGSYCVETDPSGSCTASRPWPNGDLRTFQGDIGAHGLHLLLVAESDNVSLTLPLTEIDGQQWQVILPGDQGGNVGDRYGRQLEKPLVARASPRPDLE